MVMFQLLCNWPDQTEQYEKGMSIGMHSYDEVDIPQMQATRVVYQPVDL